MSKSYIFLTIFSTVFLYGADYIDDISDAKVGECYKKVYLPAKYTEKDELIEVEKASKKIKVTDPVFKQVEQNITIRPSYTDIKDSLAKFEKKKIKLPINNKEIYFTIGKNKEIPLSDDFVKYVKSKGAKLDELKIGECYQEYVKLAPKKVVQKDYIKKQAYEIIDVEPPKFKIVKKKIEIKPAYTKIVKTPAVYETKVVKVLLKPAKKEYITKSDGTVCVVETPPKYKEIVKKILKTPPMTKVIKFPPVYKEIEVKVLEKEPVIRRRVVPQKVGKYDFYISSGENIYFWSKQKTNPDAKATGLKICKRAREIKYIEKEIEVVSSPATTKKIIIPAKTINIKLQKLVKEASTITINTPAQYERVKSKVLIRPAKIVWKRVECQKEEKDSKQKAIK